MMAFFIFLGICLLIFCFGVWFGRINEASGKRKTPNGDGVWSVDDHVKPAYERPRGVGDGDIGVE